MFWLDSAKKGIWFRWEKCVKKHALNNELKSDLTQWMKYHKSIISFIMVQEKEMKMNIDAVCPSNYYQWVALHLLSFTIEVSKVQNVLLVVVGYDPTLPTSNICQISLILFF